jgi:hypothetical protein
MNTHSLNQNNYRLKLLKFLKTHSSGTSTPPQEDSLNQGNSTFTQHPLAFRQLQQTYSLERRCFF